MKRELIVKGIVILIDTLAAIVLPLISSKLKAKLEDSHQRKLVLEEITKYVQCRT